jgi:hypothetical protein
MAIAVTLQLFNQARSCFKSRVKVRKLRFFVSVSGFPEGAKTHTVTLFLCTSMPQQRRYFCSMTILSDPGAKDAGERIDDIPTRVHPRTRRPQFPVPENAS